VSWSRRFDEPITLPNGQKLITLADAIARLPTKFQPVKFKRCTT
jgi:hypothetical protein